MNRLKTFMMIGLMALCSFAKKSGAETIEEYLENYNIDTILIACPQEAIKHRFNILLKTKTFLDEINEASKEDSIFIFNKNKDRIYQYLTELIVLNDIEDLFIEDPYQDIENCDEIFTDPEIVIYVTNFLFLQLMEQTMYVSLMTGEIDTLIKIAVEDNKKILDEIELLKKSLEDSKNTFEDTKILKKFLADNKNILENIRFLNEFLEHNIYDFENTDLSFEDTEILEKLLEETEKILDEVNLLKESLESKD